uniref:Uncharacterized protein n=1 Tax=Anguilla anguilla TaxID=7936 RepID=A0A0E9T617_ANGAN
MHAFTHARMHTHTHQCMHTKKIHKILPPEESVQHTSRQHSRA